MNVAKPDAQAEYCAARALLREVEAAQKTEHSCGAEGLVRVTAQVMCGLACIVQEVSTLVKEHSALLVELSLEDRLVDIMPEGYDCRLASAASRPRVRSSLT